MQVIQRVGHWLLDPLGTNYIIPAFSPDALLGLGLWPGVAQKDYTLFWDERFHVNIPESLMTTVFPQLSNLDNAVEEGTRAANAGSRANMMPANAREVARVLRFGCIVVVQDALLLAETYPENPIHNLLLGSSAFR